MTHLLLFTFSSVSQHKARCLLRCCCTCAHRTHHCARRSTKFPLVPRAARSASEAAARASPATMAQTTSAALAAIRARARGGHTARRLTPCRLCSPLPLQSPLSAHPRYAKAHEHTHTHTHTHTHFNCHHSQMPLYAHYRYVPRMQPCTHAIACMASSQLLAYSHSRPRIAGHV